MTTVALDGRTRPKQTEHTAVAPPNSCYTCELYVFVCVCVCV